MSLSEIDMTVEHRCVAFDVVNSVQRLAHVGLLGELLLVLRWGWRSAGTQHLQSATIVQAVSRKQCRRR